MKSNPLKLVVSHDPGGPSQRFLNLTRNVKLESPRRFEPTHKDLGDVVI